MPSTQLLSALTARCLPRGCCQRLSHDALCVAHCLPSAVHAGGGPRLHAAYAKSDVCGITSAGARPPLAPCARQELVLRAHVAPQTLTAAAQVFGETDISHAACVCVHKKELYASVKKLRAMGGSGVLVSPMVYIFDEEPKRWHTLLNELGISEDPMKSGGAAAAV